MAPWPEDAIWHHRGCRLPDRDLAPFLVPFGAFCSNSVPLMGTDAKQRATCKPRKVFSPKNHLLFASFLIVSPPFFLSFLTPRLHQPSIRPRYARCLDKVYRRFDRRPKSYSSRRYFVHPFPDFYVGRVKKCETLLRFSTAVAFDELRFPNVAINIRNLKRSWIGYDCYLH